MASSRVAMTLPNNRSAVDSHRQRNIKMLRNNTRQRSQRQVFSTFLLKLLILVGCICAHMGVREAFATAERFNATAVGEATRKAARAPFASFVPHRFTSHDNITILHEVHERERERERETETEKPLVLNIHEVLPLKPSKKKPYTLLEKDIIAEYEKSRPLKKYELNPVVFDFNLGDLEDLEHESIKKGDLSAEEKHLLRNADADGDGGSAGDGDDDTDDIGGLIYNEHILQDDVNVLMDVDNTSVTLVTTESSTRPSTSTPTTTTTTTSTTTTTTESSTTTARSQEPLSSNGASGVTLSPHIFKILKNKNSKKGRDRMKKDESHKGTHGQFNSISRYFGVEPTAEGNVSAESLHAANLFQMMTNLYDHFYWQAADISRAVSTGCGLEMQAYLTALHGNFEWAQKAYDSSGRYRGQLLYGNDKWLGQRVFCYELNRPAQPDERRHFDFEFYAIVVGVRLWLPGKLDIKLQVGECLPKTCTTHDVHAMLALDPHAHMLASVTTVNGANANANATSASNASSLIQVQRVRTVPGIFSYWRELKFQLFISFVLTLVLVVITASWYEARLNQRQLIAAIPAISAKVDCMAAPGGAHCTLAGGKAFELYQMNTLNENNNIVDIETGISDLNGKKGAPPNQQQQPSDQQQQLTDQQRQQQLRNTNQNGNTDGIAVATPTPTTTAVDLDKSQMADYKLDASSSAGAAGTYEAKKQLGLHEQILLCFAFQTNASTILNIDGHKEVQTSCVHGLRVLSVLWTIMVHTYLQVFNIGENRFQRIIVERSVWYQIVGNATFSVDTFFFISGFLVTLLYLKQEKRYPDATGQFVRRSFADTGLYWFYRYIRLTPAYLFVILFNDFSLRQTFDNSVFQPTVAPNTCGLYWWRNILYINNFYPMSEMCMIWSWYMANDMQFYIMATCLLVLSTRYFKTAVLTVCTFLLTSWAVSGIISLQYHYTHKVANPFESFDFLYDKPWQRVGTYLMGMIAGYIIYKVKTPPKISPRANWLLWTGSWGLILLIIFGVWYGELSPIATAFYVSIGHTAFGLGLVWIVLSCCWGLSPVINRMLSYRCLWPLSRLTYCTYLIHPVLMLITSFRMSGTVQLNNILVLTIFLGNAVISFGAAFVISVMLEAPVIRLLKICYRK